MEKVNVRVEDFKKSV